MDAEGHHHQPGQPYSGRNKIPNIQEFMAQLDSEKKQRDAAIDDELKHNKQGNEIKDHKNEKKAAKKDTRTVRDPVTGKDVDIEDVKLDFGKVVDDPQVHLPLSVARASANTKVLGLRFLHAIREKLTMIVLAFGPQRKSR
jgi:hypothetical protein